MQLRWKDGKFFEILRGFSQLRWTWLMIAFQPNDLTSMSSGATLINGRFYISRPRRHAASIKCQEPEARSPRITALSNTNAKCRSAKSPKFSEKNGTKRKQWKNHANHAGFGHPFVSVRGLPSKMHASTCSPIEFSFERTFPKKNRNLHHFPLVCVHNRSPFTRITHARQLSGIFRLKKSCDLSDSMRPYRT